MKKDRRLRREGEQGKEVERAQKGGLPARRYAVCDHLG